ncbi:isoprenoid synthase domain-containing protein [Gymnopilus junonius]|uniref:Terpene synthase n=1 Tax=Gymnopilus junonius TaxID=109634 RepID=A0A9P5NZW6_GYMJU|nr:isoprenoid synthase domain-containing protein [Gymnopilus junonius]
MDVYPLVTEASPQKPESFILPDLISHCKFALFYHADGDEVAKQSVDWLDSSCPDLTDKQRRALHVLQAGELTAYCYYAASKERLRIISDFMNYLFHLDNISDGMMTQDTDLLADIVMNAFWFNEKYIPTSAAGKVEPEEELSPGRLGRDFWARCIPDCGPGAQARFKETMQLFFEAVNIEARARDEGILPDLESYIDVRRDTSGCKPCWALIEYGLGIDLPDFVVENPIVRALNQGTNDLVTWSNYQGISLQEAVDYVGDLCAQTINAFVENKSKLPSWGAEINDMVSKYVQGLEAWIVGSLHWSFQTHRYFGEHGLEVKRTRIVKLLPVRKQA